MNIEDFNKKGEEEARSLLFQCCGSSKWVGQVMKDFPFSSPRQLVEKATAIWYESCDQADWLEAFGHHPKIGDVASLEKKFASTKHLASQEQAKVNSASKETINQLADCNAKYEQKNGFIFIVCATDKSAEEMLRLLIQRLDNVKEEEVHIAMGEQHKITILRLKKLLSNTNWQDIDNSQLTTHVLDTSIGKPAKGMDIILQEFSEQNWHTISQGVTDSNGRVSDFLPSGRMMKAKKYKLIFDTDTYFQNSKTVGFYPQVEIQFSILDDQHYHVPLLISPYGYSTYRGS